MTYTQWIEIDEKGNWHKSNPPHCTYCDKPVSSFEYDPVNGGEIQLCRACNHE